MYEFVVKFGLPDMTRNASDYLDALYEAGCDDAVVGTGKPGSIALDFSREAASADEAMHSAIQAVGQAIPGASLVEVEPDLVTLTDIAELVGCSRQNMRKYAMGDIKSISAPFPPAMFTGDPMLWHLAEVAAWLKRNTEFQLPANVAGVARVAFKLNLDVQQRREQQLVAA